MAAHGRGVLPPGSVTSTDSGSAPPAYAAATASEVAIEPPGAMKVTDWNTTPYLLPTGRRLPDVPLLGAVLPLGNQLGNQDAGEAAGN